MKVEKLIRQSLEELLKIGNENVKDIKTQKGRLIFPIYGNGKNNIRISEQEARFLFIRELEKDENPEYYYSVETPTTLKYQFSKDKKKLDEPLISNDGESARIDVCLYNEKIERIHLVEFKAHLSDKFEIKKDFLKLRYENSGKKLTNYFIHIFPSYNSRTITELQKNYKEAFELRDKVQKNDINDINVIVCMLRIPKKYTSGNIRFFNESNYENELETIKS
jgi:hypothetical protein